MIPLPFVLLFAAATVAPATTAPLSAPPETKPPVDPIAEPLVKSVAEISAKDDPTAKDYARMADATLDFARRKTQASQALNRNVIESALDAVDAGESHNAKAADWPKLREELKSFLDDKEQQKPPPQDKDKNQDNQDKSDESDKKDQQSKDQKSDDRKSDNQKSDDSQKNEQKSDADKPEKDEGASGSSKRDNPSQSEQGTPPESSQKNAKSAFGDMNEARPTPPPPKPEDAQDAMQKVGGKPKSETSQAAHVDPRLVIPLQKLDQLKQQDSPAKLFRMMEGPRSPNTAKKGKDW